jgi:subtilisin family serine protease
LARVLETKIFVKRDQTPGEGQRETEYVTFDVPKAGEAILRVVNGARIGSAPDERVAGVEINLNGERVVMPGVLDKQANLLGVRVPLRQGTNRLGVKLQAAPTQRISVRIDAPADKIVLTMASGPVVVGDPLKVSATVTALGLAVTNAQIAFQALDVEQAPERLVTTNTHGVARAKLRRPDRAGDRRLVATVIGSKGPLYDQRVVKVVKERTIALHQGISTTTIEAGSEIPISLLVKYLKYDGLTRSGSDGKGTPRISFESKVEPHSGGIELSGDVVRGGFTPSMATTFIASGKIRAIVPGTYTIASTAAVTETGEAATADITVNVVPPRPAKKLVLSQPTLQPGGIPIGARSLITFGVRASGVTDLPSLLELQECEPKRNTCGPGPDDRTWTRLGNLYDDGKQPDFLRGDRVYLGRFEVTAKEEGEKLYRVRGTHSGDAVASPARFLKVTRFPIGPSSAKFDIIRDPSTHARFAAERVLVSFHPLTPPDRIEAVVHQATQKATGKNGSVAGYLPEIGVLELKLEQICIKDQLDCIRKRAAAVSDTVAELERYDEVRYAEPDFALELAGVVTPEASDVKHWGAVRVRADEAWVVARGTGVTVAVVDTGVDNTHPDLAELVTGDPPGSSGSHGTEVAGVLAARYGNGGITGIGHGAQIKSFNYGPSLSATNLFGANMIIAAGNDATVRILNFSATAPADNSTLECAVKYAVAPTGQSVPRCSGTSIAQAVLQGRGILMVAAAGNDGREILSSATCDDNNPCNFWPCLWDDPYNADPNDPGLVLCVGNSTVADPSNLSSEDNVFEANQAGWGANKTSDNQDCGCVRPSNYGDAVDIWAPGTCIRTTAPGNQYVWATGTSFAAPHVAGAAAIVWAKLEMEAQLQGSGDDVTAYDVRKALLDGAYPFTDTIHETASPPGITIDGFRLDLLESLFTVSRFTGACESLETFPPLPRHGRFLTKCEGDDVDGQYGPSLGRWIGHLRIRKDYVPDVSVQFDYALITCDYPLSPNGPFKQNTDQATIGLFLDNRPSGFTGVVGNFIITTSPPDIGATPFMSYSRPGCNGTGTYAGWMTKTVQLPEETVTHAFPADETACTGSNPCARFMVNIGRANSTGTAPFVLVDHIRLK